MEYLKHYNLLISTRRQLNREKIKYDGLENHHIIPRSMGGDNSKENLILLTTREHFIAHQLLWMIHRNSSMVHAFFLMCNMKRYRCSSRQYEKAKENYQIIKSNESKNKRWIKKDGKNIRINSQDLDNFLKNGWIKGRLEYSEEVNKRLSGRIFITNNDSEKLVREYDLEEWLSNGWYIGRKAASPESIQKMRESLTGVKLSKEHCANISKGKKGIPNSKEHNKNIKKGWEKREPMSEETKEKIGNKKRNVPLSEEHKSKLSRSIIFFGIYYPSILSAARELNRSTCFVNSKLNHQNHLDCYKLKK